MALNEEKLNAFIGKMLTDIGAAMNASLLLIGDKLGLYRALAEGGPMTPSELAARTSTTERYVREWLSAQAASEYVSYDRESGKFTIGPEQAAVFANEDSPCSWRAWETCSPRP